MGKSKYLINIIISVLILYISLTLTNFWGPFLPQGIYLFNKPLVIVLLVGAIFSAVRKKKKFIIPGIKWMTVLTIYVLIQGVVTNNDFWFFNFHYVLWVYIVFIITINFINTKSRIKIYGITAIILILSGSLFYYYTFYKSGFMGTERPDLFDMGYENFNTNTISQFLVLDVIIAEFIIKRNSIFANIILNLLYLISGVLIMFSGSRFAFFLLVLIFSISILSKVKLNAKSIRYMSFVFLFVIIVFIPIFRTYYNEIGYFSHRLENTGNYTNELRFKLMKEAVNIFYLNPIFGWNSDLVYSKAEFIHNHLWYLNFLCSYGIFGFTLLFGALYEIVKGSLKNKNILSIMFLLFMFLVLFFAPMLLYFSVPLSFVYIFNHYGNRKTPFEFTERNIEKM